MSSSKVEAKVRVEVRDEKGKVVKVIEERTKSFTQSFFTLLVASQFYTPNVPQLSFYDVMGTTFTTGYNAYPAAMYAIGVPQQMFCVSNCPLLLAYANYVITSPGIWFGSSQCGVTYTAPGPCAPIPTSILSPGQFSYTSTVAQGQGGWQLQYSQTWTNITNSTINIGSVALVLGAIGSTLTCYGSCPQGWSPGLYLLYSMIIDNISPSVTLNPGWYITATYTITFPT